MLYLHDGAIFLHRFDCLSSDLFFVTSYQAALGEIRLGYVANVHATTASVAHLSQTNPF
jgi:hypothetical protein